MIHERLPGISEIRAHLRRCRRDQGADPGAADGALQYGRHRHELSRRGPDPRRTAIRDTVVPGLMAVGEAACVSVHGANRLGSNSLIDLVVFGKAAAQRCAETHHTGRAHADLPKDSAEACAGAARPIPQRQGQDADRRNCGCRCRKRCRNNCAVFRTGEVLQEGQKPHPRGVRFGARCQRHRPFADLEHRSGRDAGVRQSDPAGRGHDGFGAVTAPRAAARMRARTFPTATTPTG